LFLSDGSLVTLNTTSAIDVHFGGAQQRITLLEGEACSGGTTTSRRPFEVTGGEANGRAVGTQFNVDSPRADAESHGG